MSFFPDDYDPRDLVLGGLDLCEIDTPAGAQRFMIGTDGLFIDVNGNGWFGSELIGVTNLASAIGGNAPSGSVTLTFIQDPDEVDLISEVRALGMDYINGRSIKFFFQPIKSQAEFYAPTIAPIQFMERKMRTLTFAASGAQDRSITLGFEAWSEDRKSARRTILNTEGHSRMLDEYNPSLEFMPTHGVVLQKLFG
ncbi:MAG: hypothetical protein ACPG4X_21015 [Pikeienuella sp.]